MLSYRLLLRQSLLGLRPRLGVGVVNVSKYHNRRFRGDLREVESRALVQPFEQGVSRRATPVGELGHRVVHFRGGAEVAVQPAALLRRQLLLQGLARIFDDQVRALGPALAVDVCQREVDLGVLLRRRIRLEQCPGAFLDLIEGRLGPIPKALQPVEVLFQRLAVNRTHEHYPREERPKKMVPK